jgi:rod shape-determining protein MreD
MASGDGRSSGLRVTLTVILGLVFSLIPLPEVIDPWRPNLLLLFVIYWSLSAPNIAGLLFAWLCGFATDLLTGMTLGQHAWGFLLVAYATHKVQLRMRIFPLYHQTLTVFMFLAIYEAFMFWLDGVTGHKLTTWLRWMPVVSGAIFWPIIVAVLDTWNRRRR